MKPPQFYVTVAISGLCLVLSVWAIVINHANAGLQLTLQNQQAQINMASQTEQLRQQILNDLAQVALKDNSIKQLLAHNGITVNARPTPSPSTSSSSSK